MADTTDSILGMDFIGKFKLGFIWDDFDQSELYIYDKKAQIQKQLQIVTIPADTQRLSYISPDQSKGLLNFAV